METKQLIQASAEVVTIASFRKGDVYKRVETGYSDPALRYGIVQSVMNNGTDSAFTAIEMKPDYNAGVVVETKVFDGSKPAALFAAEPGEVAAHLQDIRLAVERRRETAEQAFVAAERAVELVEEITRNVTDSALTSPDVIRGAIAEA